MDAITLEVAREIARREVEQLAKAAGDTFELLPEQTKYVEEGWLFFFNSSDFVQSRNPADALAGNGPLLVRHDGNVHHLPTSITWEEALKKT
jgi:hypothetical protein